MNELTADNVDKDIAHMKILLTVIKFYCLMMKLLCGGLKSVVDLGDFYLPLLVNCVTAMNETYLTNTVKSHLYVLWR